MSQYTQLTQKHSYQLYVFLEAGFLRSDTACEIGVHKCSIRLLASVRQAGAWY